ncbi:hypothetical protein [Halorubrum lacusprofundi]|jgi:hypothetical protein|uniref:Uncharacterized protein n=1 Tax=Halorubrum lacusprofundi (strain ATCC 49239 / DSM 5036 / JCM 8891 / ACAM 34) TaxID=416348 RepID=B9LQ17_HALLT|nr:hypothetical protein [Halorubrum lacusprofundi]ACM57455.1 hypothetical protein Hlac_1877 [Halorubrum lacusprofundi ATCC 49239]MCG1005947.1 hypothetical protein [Halorubrum lacusprofundi]
MTPSLRRRRLLAAAVPGLLAGCLVESSEDAGGSGDGTETSASDDASDSESENGDDGERESLSEDEKSAAEQADDGDSPDEVGPDGSGLVVTNVDVLSVTDDGYETTVEAQLTVENAGRFTYGTVELRVDAYATRPNSIEREAVGYDYVTERFSSDDRFAGGTRRFDASITFRSRETRARPDPDWYEVDAALRRAEPV